MGIRSKRQEEIEIGNGVNGYYGAALLTHSRTLLPTKL